MIDKTFISIQSLTQMADSAFDKLWSEYTELFRSFDDHSLARWLSQTLGQFEGKILRLSHPLMGAYRIAAQVADEKQVWLKRLATIPSAFGESGCCQAPFLPLFTREILESGLCCQHCGEILVPFADLPETVQPLVRTWAEEYAPLHAVAHWEESQQNRGDYEEELENAASRCEKLLSFAGKNLMPHLVEFYPTLVWEDQDECLEVRPEDIEL